jgi:ribosome biogenesis GTPase A
MMEDSLSLVDAVCEILDARIPHASSNPDIYTLAGDKPRLTILNRTDLADPAVTKQWAGYFDACGIKVIETDARSGKGVNAFIPAVRELLKDKVAAYAAKGQAGRTLRVMILGIPNVGKSTFINKVAGRKAAAVSDRPGVTRGKQWITVDRGMELLDTPGLLWPRFDSREIGEHLAWTGAVKDGVADMEALAAGLLPFLRERYPADLEARYKLKADPTLQGWELLEAAARKRGFLISGGEVDTERMSQILLDEFRAGTIGRISLETPEEQL